VGLVYVFIINKGVVARNVEDLKYAFIIKKKGLVRIADSPTNAPITSGSNTVLNVRDLVCAFIIKGGVIV